MMAKVRADREAARIKREAQEKAQAAERSAMQMHDKPCYQSQSQPGSGTGGSRVASTARRRSAGLARPASGLSSANTGAEGADWAVVPDPAAGTTPATSTKVAAPAPRPVVKPKPPVDLAAAEHLYYQQALPPKRAAVPRIAAVVDSAVKQQKAEVSAHEGRC
jgi:hypothetical protein